MTDEEKLAQWMVILAGKLYSSQITANEVIRQMKLCTRRYEDTLKQQSILPIDLPQDEKPLPKIAVLEEDAKEIFAYWQARSGKSKALYTNDRVSKIKARLSEGYPKQDLKKAVDGMLADPWCVQHGVNDLMQCFGSGSKLERYRDAVRQNWAPVDEAPANTPDDALANKLRALRKEASEAKSRGMKEKYVQILEQIRSISG